ncbi:MAG: DUF4339 domain-containing protein [Verrucomicrobia bacterium]|nr:DUF4339 domain-containing protein [Verrucomicrobiota bacterium]
MEIVVIWAMCGVVAAMIGARKGEGCAAFFIGFLFGPFGVLFAFLRKGNRCACRFCQELVNKDALVCPYCQREIASSHVSEPVYSIPSANTVDHSIRYFIYSGEAVIGPYTKKELSVLHLTGEIDSNTQCCIEGTKEWVSFHSIV